MAQYFSVDVGGTFTDLVVMDTSTGAVSFAKASTVPSEPARGILAAIAKSDLALGTAETFFHGTTLGLNAMLERKGARTGLITTMGCRDVLEIRRLDWPAYQLSWTPPTALVPRYLRREVNERMRADGMVLHPLDEDEVVREASTLVAEGVESIAICFMHSYAHPEHELRAGAAIQRAFPTISVTLSHQVAQEYREYERSCTTVSDAMIKRRMADYLTALEQALRDQSFTGSFLVTRCDGGVMSAEEAKQRPVRTMISGPASGVMGMVTLGKWLGIPNMIGADMGGTSLDASLVIGHQPAMAATTTIADIPLLMPVIELMTIGAGGGSIAWIDQGGALNVGPQSAGAEPGPVSYGRGGTEPTFTDAALVCGLLDPDKFLGGEMKIDLAAAHEAIRTKIAEPLRLDTETAAAGIVALAEAKMAGTLEELTIGKGYDPRDFTLVPFGGGGSLVASALATKLSIPKIVVPPSPGTFSAWGMLSLDVVHDFARTAITSLDSLSREYLVAQFNRLAEQAEQALDREQVDAASRSLLCSLDMRYEGQEHVLSIPINLSPSAPSPAQLRQVFEEQYARVYGYCLPDPAEITAWRIRAVGSLPKPARPMIVTGGESAEHARIGSRQAIHTNSGGACNWNVYQRERMLAGNSVRGPAIIEESAAATLVAPGWIAAIDEMGNLIMTSEPEQLA